MKLRTYNAIKNFMLGTAAAVFYNGYVVENAKLISEIFGTVAIGILVFILMNSADREFLKNKKREKSQERTEEEQKEMSA